jgi:hypothetical protein
MESQFALRIGAAVKPERLRKYKGGGAAVIVYSRGRWNRGGIFLLSAGHSLVTTV